VNISTSVKERTSNLFKDIYVWFGYHLGDQKPKGAITALDGVRAIACIMVVTFHSTSVINGYSNILQTNFFNALNLLLSKGTILFFLLSGFLLFLPYVKALLFEKSWPQARMFYLRRTLRIVPGYFFSLFAIILLEKPSYLEFHHWLTLLSFLTFFMTHSQSSAMNPVYWTLAVEFQYYMLLPLIALGIYGLTRLVCPKQRLWVVAGSLFAMIIWGLAARFWGETLFAKPNAQVFLTSHPVIRIITFVVYGSSSLDSGKYIEDFAVGMLLAVCYIVMTNTSRGEIYQRVFLRLSPWLWWLGLALLAFAAWQNIGVFVVYPRWGIELTYGLGFGCCILAILFNGSGLLKRIFEWTPLRWIGLISFSTYLWQFPLIDILKLDFSADLFKHFSRLLALIIFASLECIVMLSFSFILYVLVEKPGMRLSERLRQKILARQKQKELARTVNTRSQDAEFDPEKTEPRQAIALARTPSH
jgi:peptidoglycan/LPS O-acetylase OafA/YrhL